MEREKRTNRLHLARPARHNPPLGVSVDVERGDKDSGYVVSLRAIDYQGTETYCDGTGNGASRLVTVNTAPGFDGMTGIGTISSKFIHWMATA